MAQYSLFVLKVKVKVPLNTKQTNNHGHWKLTNTHWSATYDFHIAHRSSSCDIRKTSRSKVKDEDHNILLLAKQKHQNSAVNDCIGPASSVVHLRKPPVFIKAQPVCRDKYLMSHGLNIHRSWSSPTPALSTEWLSYHSHMWLAQCRRLGEPRPTATRDLHVYTSTHRHTHTDTDTQT